MTKRRARAGKKEEMPHQLFVYIMDEVDGDPVYGLAISSEDLLTDMDGQVVGVYELINVKRLQVTNTLVDVKP